MPLRAEVLRDRTIGGEDALSALGWREAVHPSLPLPGRSVGILGTIVQIPVLSVCDARENLALRRAIAPEFIGDDAPWDILTPVEELPKELLGGLFVASALHQNIEDIP